MRRRKGGDGIASQESFLDLKTHRSQWLAHTRTAEVTEDSSHR